MTMSKDGKGITDPKGVSFIINIGSYGGFYTSFSTASWRICLGWICFTLLFKDIDWMFGEWMVMGNYISKQGVSVTKLVEEYDHERRKNISEGSSQGSIKEH